MKKLLLLLAIILLASCKDPTPKPEKPFVIYDIYYSSQNQRKSGWVHYKYVDENGERFSFTSKYGEYHIGDTIH